MPLKKSTAAVALTSALVLAIGGTWAYTNLVQNQTNDYSGTMFPGVRLHDDFDQAAATAGALSNDKDVYVENYGDEPQYVRIRLVEYMERQGTPVVAGTCKDYPLGLEATETSTDTCDPWTVHVLGAAAADDPFHTWWDWTLGGQKYYLPTDNQDNDPTDDAADATPAFGADDPDNNTAKYTADNVYGGSDPVHNSLGTDEVNHVAQTLPANTISMADWLLLSDTDKKACSETGTGCYWILDTDGWAYWSAPLAPNTATGLLLDAVDHTSVHETVEYYYAIHVVLEAVTWGDGSKMAAQGMTSDAKSALAGLGVNFVPELIAELVADGYYNHVENGHDTDDYYDLPLQASFEDANDDPMTYNVTCEAITANIECAVVDGGAEGWYEVTTSWLDTTSGTGTVVIIATASDPYGTSDPPMKITVNYDPSL
jgi:hypothetical protein